MADLFISCTLWIVTDENQLPIVFKQGNRSTVIIDIIRATSKEINSESDFENEEDTKTSAHDSTNSRFSTTIGERLIA